jgi:ABC-type Fe3+-citrate transport system substrate-binding protein
MKEITLKIPDNQLSFFMELFAQLGIEVAEEVDIPEKHKEIVRERLRTTNPEEMIPWSEARKQLNFNSMP